MPKRECDLVDLRKKLQGALNSLESCPLRDASISLLNALGYYSDKTIKDLFSTPDAFIEMLTKNNPECDFNKEKSLFHEWRTVDLLFQITDEEVFGPRNPASLRLVESYIFFAIELNQPTCSNDQLREIVRQLNRAFYIPIMLIIKVGGYLSIAIIDRRIAKNKKSKDVLTDVTMLRDISIADPHLGHIDTLISCSLPRLQNRIRNFEDLHDEWKKFENWTYLESRPYSTRAGSNVENRTILIGDCLDIMRGMNSESVDLIYLDPPFNPHTDYASKVRGNDAAADAFVDSWTLADVDVEWINLIKAKYPSLLNTLHTPGTNSGRSYLAYMSARLFEMHRLLKPAGAIYLYHPEPHMSSYLKRVMKGIQNIFGHGRIIEDYWKDINTNEAVVRSADHLNERPLGILEKIIRAYSSANDLVFDPFCGHATSLAAAENLRRKWIGIDISPKAEKLAIVRIGQNSSGITCRTDIPHRTDIGTLPPYNCSENCEWLYSRQNEQCAECKTHFGKQHLKMGQIISDGIDHVENLQLICGWCNRKKNSRGIEYLKKTLRL